MTERVVVRLMAWGVLKEPTEFQQISYEPVPKRATRSLAHEAFIVAVDPASGRASPAADWAIRAALLLELRLEGRITVSGSDAKTTVTVVDPHALGDRELDDTLQLLNRRRPQKVTRQASYMPSDLSVTRTLTDEGALVEESYKRLGMFSSCRVVLTPAARREELVDRLRSALSQGAAPDERTALLIAALEPFVPFKQFMPKEQAKQSRRRAVRIAEEVGESYHALVQAVRCAQGRESSDVQFS